MLFGKDSKIDGKGRDIGKVNIEKFRYVVGDLAIVFLLG